MGRTYYTLLSRTSRNGQWAIEFGAYEREDVEQERDDMRDSHYEGPRPAYHIITTDDSQASIDARVAELNAR
jgi:hypothetical protein